MQQRVVASGRARSSGRATAPYELTALAHFAHAHDLLLHVDGARLANAAAALEVPLRAITTDVGVDVVSFGGTKNGMLLGEAVVFLRPELADGFQYLRKQTLQLASKGRFLAAQFIALLEGDLWRRNAAHANAMAARLAAALVGVPGVTITQPVQANGVFAILAERRHGGAAARLAVLRLERGDRGGALAVLVGHDAQDEVDAFAAAVSSAPRL